MLKVVKVYLLKVTIKSKIMKNKNPNSYSCLIHMNWIKITTKGTLIELNKSSLIYYMFLNPKFKKNKNKT